MTIDDWIAQAALRAPDHCAIEYAGETLSYSAFEATIEAKVAELRSSGLGMGDRVAWYGMNAPEVFILLFACARMGAIFVPLNWRLADDEIDAIWASCAPAALYHDAAFAEKAARLKTFAPGGARGQAHAQSPLLIVYTSGSTGIPKGVVLTQAAIMANARMSIDAHGLTPEDRVLNVLPLFHVGGLNILPTPAFSIGATVVLHQSFAPSAMIADLARVQAAIVVPTVLGALLTAPEWADADLSGLRCLSIGSTDVPLEMIRAIHARGIPILQIYGATETAPFAIYQTYRDAMTTEGSIGRAGLCDIRLMRTDGSEAGEDEPAEIWVRGENTLKEYWRNPELSTAMIEDGWFKTGDVASRDAQGQYYFRDRIKHIIISGGENIYPAEIERALRTHPQVVEVSVVGVPDPKWGETPVAVVVPDGALEADALLATLKGALARYKHPQHVIFVEALPRNAMGKVVAEKIRALAIDRLGISGMNGAIKTNRT